MEKLSKEEKRIVQKHYDNEDALVYFILSSDQFGIVKDTWGA